MTDQLSLTFAALADPTRRAILARLATGERSVTELAAPFHMSLPAVTKHLKVLERAGLITRGREAQWRPCRLAPTPLRDVSNWLDQYRRFWEESIDRLEIYLRELQAKGTGAEPAATQAAPATADLPGPAVAPSRPAAKRAKKSAGKSPATAGAASVPKVPRKQPTKAGSTTVASPTPAATGRAKSSSRNSPPAAAGEPRPAPRKRGPRRP